MLSVLLSKNTSECTSVFRIVLERTVNQLNSFYTSKRNGPHREDWGTMTALWELRKQHRTWGTSERHCWCIPYTGTVGGSPTHVLRLTRRPQLPLLELDPAERGRHHSMHTKLAPPPGNWSSGYSGVLLFIPTGLHTQGTAPVHRNLAKLCSAHTQSCPRQSEQGAAGCMKGCPTWRKSRVSRSLRNRHAE